MPRGGVAVAAGLRSLIGGALDLVVARKLGAPRNPELAIGAVAADGVPYVDHGLARRLGVSDRHLASETKAQVAEVDRRLRAYRGDRPPPEVAGRDVIVIDDGVATGATLVASLRYVSRMGPGSLSCAVPVGPPDTVARLAAEVDEMVCPLQPPLFRAVGEWYHDFHQISDSEVMTWLGEAWQEDRPP